MLPPNVLRQIYTGPIETVSKRIGLHSHLSFVYWTYRDFIRPDVYTIEFNANNITFPTPSSTAYRRVKKLERLPDEIVRVVNAIEPGDTYWDIGANIGTHSLIPASVVSELTVVAIEAHPDNAGALTKGVKINNIDDFTVIKKALGDEAKPIELRLEGAEVGEGSHSILSEKYDGIVETTMITGDELAETYPSPNVIKIDVQAAELKVLDGLAKTIRGGSCRTIFCEAHRRRGVSPEAVCEELADAGFDTKIVADHGNAAMVRGDKS